MFLVQMPLTLMPGVPGVEMRAYTPIIYGISVFLLFLPFVPGVGARIAGARAWIDLPGGTLPFTDVGAQFVPVITL